MYTLRSQCAVLALSLCSASVPAQVFYERFAFGSYPYPSQIRPTGLYDCPAPSIPPNPPPLLPPPGPLPPPIGPGPILTPAYPNGDLAHDSLGNWVISTDGATIVYEHDTFFPLNGAPAVWPYPTQVFASPAVLGPLTGIAADPTAGLLWCTDGGSVSASILGNPSVSLTLPATFQFTVWSPPMTGLDYDPVAGHLVGCDMAGNVYRFTGSGAAVGPQPWSWSQWPGQASDLAVARTPGSAHGVFVQYRAEGHVHEYGAGPTCPNHSSTLGVPGASFILGEGLVIVAAAQGPTGPHPIYNYSSPFAGWVGTSRPTTLGTAPFACFIETQIAFAPTYFLLDFAYEQASASGWATLPVFTPGQVLPFPPALIVPAFGDAAGRVEVGASLDLPAAYAGIDVYVQWVYPSVSYGLALSDALRIRLTLP